jgi:hypothetical protein
LAREFAEEAPVRGRKITKPIKAAMIDNDSYCALFQLCNTKQKLVERLALAKANAQEHLSKENLSQRVRTSLILLYFLEAARPP